jgi:hypothetical protein
VPTWLIERGFRSGIFAVDCLEAVHVHVVGYGGIAKLWLGPIRVAREHGYDRYQLSEMVRMARGTRTNPGTVAWAAASRPGGQVTDRR